MKKKRGDQKLIIKIMLMVIIIVLGVLYKVSSSTIIEDQLEGVENQVVTTLYKENQGAGGNGGSGGTGSVIPGGSDSGDNGSENGGSQTVDKTTVQELPNYATKLNPDGTTPSLTTKTVVGQDLDSLKNALVSNNVLTESEAANVDGIVVITGDVSNVGSLEVDTSKYCSSGETVAVVTYDEAKKTYSYVGNGTVNTSNKVITSVNGGSSKTDFASVKDDNTIVAALPSEYYTISWDASLSSYGTYIGEGDVPVISTNYGCKRIVYTNEYGETSYVNPYEAGIIHVKKNTDFYLQMYSGSSGSSKYGDSYDSDVMWYDNSGNITGDTYSWHGGGGRLVYANLKNGAGTYKTCNGILSTYSDHDWSTSGQRYRWYVKITPIS